MGYTSEGIGYQSTETSRQAINAEHLLTVRVKGASFSAHGPAINDN